MASKSVTYYPNSAIYATLRNVNAERAKYNEIFLRLNLSQLFYTVGEKEDSVKKRKEFLANEPELQKLCANSTHLSKDEAEVHYSTFISHISPLYRHTNNETRASFYLAQATLRVAMNDASKSKELLSTHKDSIKAEAEQEQTLLISYRLLSLFFGGEDRIHRCLFKLAKLASQRPKIEKSILDEFTLSLFLLNEKIKSDPDVKNDLNYQKFCSKLGDFYFTTDLQRAATLFTSGCTEDHFQGATPKLESNLMICGLESMESDASEFLRTTLNEFKDEKKFDFTRVNLNFFSMLILKGMWEEAKIVFSKFDPNEIKDAPEEMIYILYNNLLTGRFINNEPFNFYGLINIYNFVKERNDPLKFEFLYKLAYIFLKNGNYSNGLAQIAKMEKDQQGRPFVQYLINRLTQQDNQNYPYDRTYTYLNLKNTLYIHISLTPHYRKPNS